MKVLHVVCIVSLFWIGVTQPGISVFNTLVNDINNWSNTKKIAAAIGAVAAGYIVYSLFKKAEEPKQDSLSLSPCVDEDQLLCDLEHQDYYRSKKENNDQCKMPCVVSQPLMPSVDSCDTEQSKNAQMPCDKQGDVGQAPCSIVVAADQGMDPDVCRELSKDAVEQAPYSSVVAVDQDMEQADVCKELTKMSRS